MATSEIKGHRIYWERTGDVGEPMVLVHGSWGKPMNLTVAFGTRSLSARR